MEQKAATGEEFTIDEYTTNLAFDVIGESEKTLRGLATYTHG